MKTFELISSAVIVLFVGALLAEDPKHNGDPVDVVYGNNTVGLKDTNDTVCLLMFFYKLEVDVFGGPQNTSFLSESYNFTNIKVIGEDSSCQLKPSNNTKQRLALNVTDNYLDLYFQLNVPKKTYNMSQVTFRAYNERQFGNTSLYMLEAKMEPDLKIKQLSKNLDQSFECKYRYHLKFNFTEEKAKDVQVDIRIVGLKFSAFRNSKSTDFQTKNKISCPAPTKSNKPGNDIVPIAVGSVLTGCLVVSLVGYLVIRARRT